jgi:hypothetical protein
MIQALDPLWALAYKSDTASEIEKKAGSEDPAKSIREA